MPNSLIWDYSNQQAIHNFSIFMMQNMRNLKDFKQYIISMSLQEFQHFYQIRKHLNLLNVKSKYDDLLIL